MKKLVSIIMPVYNAELYLRRAMESVLKQDYREIELLCVNDGSTDASAEILQQYAQTDHRIKIVNNGKNIGLIASLNSALPMVTGEFFARMDADDIIPFNRISKQIKFLEEHKEIQLVSSGYTYMDQRGKNLYDVPPVAILPGALKYLSVFVTALTHAAICGRAELIKNGMFAYNKNFTHAEDFELFSRLLWNNVKAAGINEALYTVRLHASSVSGVFYQEQTNSNVRILERNLREYIKDLTPYDDQVLKTALCRIDHPVDLNELMAVFDLLNKIKSKAFNDPDLSMKEKHEVKKFLAGHTLNIVIQANKFRMKNKARGNFYFMLNSFVQLGIPGFFRLVKKLFR